MGLQPHPVLFTARKRNSQQFKMSGESNVCTLRNCSCPFDLNRAKILDKLDLMTDSLALLAGLQVEYRVKSRFTSRLGRYWIVIVYFGEDWAMEENIKGVIHSSCQLEKFFENGMVISMYYRVAKYGLEAIAYDGMDNVRQDCIDTEDEGSCTEDK